MCAQQQGWRLEERERERETSLVLHSFDLSTVITFTSKPASDFKHAHEHTFSHTQKNTSTHSAVCRHINIQTPVEILN